MRRLKATRGTGSGGATGIRKARVRSAVKAQGLFKLADSTFRSYDLGLMDARHKHTGSLRSLGSWLGNSLGTV